MAIIENQPTTSKQTKATRERFERDIIRGDKPPYYLVPEVYEKNTGMSYKNFDLPYNAGRCIVSWPNNKMQFEWRLANGWIYK